jgi:hypothetical protein
MALSVKCPKGHSYVSGDIYVNWPEEAPHCPVCFKEWENNKDIVYVEWEFSGKKQPMRVYWEVKYIGFGNITFYINNNDELIIDSEHMDKEFVKRILNYLVDHTKFTDEKEKI